MAHYLPKVLALLLVLSPLSAYATRVVQQREPIFPVNTDKLLQGEVHYSRLGGTAEALAKYDGLPELDGAGLLEAGQRYVYTKTAFVVDKPVGFFNHTQLVDERWVARFHTGRLTRQSEGMYRHEGGELHIDFDSDDLSSVRRPRVMHAISQSRRLDPVSASSFSAVTMLETDPRLRPLAFSVANHVSLSPTKTLVVVYSLRRTEGISPTDLAEKFRSF